MIDVTLPVDAAFPALHSALPVINTPLNQNILKDRKIPDQWPGKKEKRKMESIRNLASRKRGIDYSIRPRSKIYAESVETRV
jgi:hypothetical protein